MDSLNDIDFASLQDRYRRLLKYRKTLDTRPPDDPQIRLAIIEANKQIELVENRITKLTDQDGWYTYEVYLGR